MQLIIFMRLVRLLTAHGASRLVRAVSAWSVKTRRASSGACRDVRADGYASTAMHDVSIPAPAPQPFNDNFSAPAVSWFLILRTVHGGASFVGEMQHPHTIHK